MGKRNKVTTRDIAEHLGISQSTVSMILSKKENVSFSKEMIQKVEQAAKDLHYVKPENRKDRKKDNLNKTIIVICPTFSNGYYTMVSQSINQRAKEYGYTVFTVSTLRDMEQELQYMNLLSKFTLAGIISIYPPAKMTSANTLAKQIPFVLIGDKPERCHLDSIKLNSYKAGYILGEYLISLGHTRLAFISSPIRSSEINRIGRLEGLRSSFKDHNIDPAQIQVCTPSITDYKKCTFDNREYDNGYSITQNLLTDHTDVTVFIGNNDTTAYGIMAAIHENGSHIPNDYSVCGFDNLPMSNMPQIALTTIEHAARHKGQEAVDIIYRKNMQKNTTNQPYIMSMEYEPSLIIRRSTGKCKQ